MNRRLLKRLLSLIMVCSFVVLTFGCAPESATDPTTPTTPGNAAAPAASSSGASTDGEPRSIRIGYLLPLSAENAPQGQQGQRAVEMAVEEINAAGGIESLGGAKLEIVYADTQSKPQIAVQEAERLLNQDNVDFLAGAYHSGVTLPASEVAERYKRVWWCPVSSDDSITNREGFRYVFRLAEKTSMRIVAQLGYLDKMAKETGEDIKTISLVYENTGYGQGAAKVWYELLPEYGWEINLDEPYDPMMADASSVVSKVKAANSDIVLMATSAMPATIMLTKGFREQGVNPKAFFATSAAQTDPDYIINAGESCLGVFDVGGWEIDVNRPFSAEKAQKFFDKYNYTLNNEGAKEYVGMYVVKDVLERAASYDPEVIRDAFAATDLSEGISQMYAKHVMFDETGTFPYLDSLVLAQFMAVDGVIQRVTVNPEDQARPGFTYEFPYDYNK